jgi:beta-glucosidase
MRNELRHFFRWVFVAALALYAACTTEPEHKNVATPGTGGSTVTGSGGSGTGGSDSTGGTGGSTTTGTGGSTTGSGGSTTGSGGTTTGTGGSTTGTGGTTTGTGGSTTGTGGATTGTGGTGTGGTAGGGAGGTGGGPPVPPDDATCTMYTDPRVHILTPQDPLASSLVQSMTQEQKLALLSGDPTVCGAPNWNCDFNGTAIPGTSPPIPVFKMRDGPRGLHTQAGSGDAGAATSTWAVAGSRAAAFDLDLEYRVGKAQGKEMRALKIDMSLAPTINTLRHPRWARAQETYGEDPVLQGLMGAAFTRGIQQGEDAQGGVPACPKHFAGNDTDNNRQSVMMNMDEQTLRENYALPFQIVVEDADPACIMAAYNGVNGNWSAENKHLLTDILHTNWGWTGFVVSDWWATKNNGAASMNSGLDYEMPDKTAFQQLPQALASGTVQSSRIDEAAKRVLNARIKFKQLDPSYLNSPLDTAIANNQAHKDLARETAEKGTVLLKNDGILPLGPKATTVGSGLATVKSIVFLGPDRALPNLAAVSSAGQASGLGDRGSSNSRPGYAVSLLQGVQSLPAAAGITVTQSANAADASTADVAIIPVSMAHEDEGEAFDGGQDRQNCNLTNPHPLHWPAGNKPAAFINAAAAANPNVIVVLMVGSAVLMEDWMASAKGIVQTFYPGQEGGTAFAKLLFADINFSAKVPFTVAQNEADYPAFQNNVAQAQVAYLHGYRKFEAENLKPRLWFGSGLSYTRYEYSDLKILCTNGITEAGRLNVQVTVKNAGTMAGDEIVQLYVGSTTTARRPKKELKAFARVTLAPGESKNVQLMVPTRDLAYWNMTQNAWVVEKVGTATNATGEHTVFVGPSADPATLLPAKFTIK